MLGRILVLRQEPAEAANALDALCSVAVANDIGTAPAWIEELAEVAARAGMRDLAVRAYLHPTRSGDDDALTAARMLAAGIETPALSSLLADPPRSGAGVRPARAAPAP